MWRSTFGAALKLLETSWPCAGRRGGDDGKPTHLAGACVPQVGVVRCTLRKDVSRTVEGPAGFAGLHHVAHAPLKQLPPIRTLSGYGASDDGVREGSEPCE